MQPTFAVVVFFAVLCSQTVWGQLTPLSEVCRKFNYTRYFRISSYAELTSHGQTAMAGDMIELIGGVYYLGDGILNSSNPGQGYSHNGPDAEVTSARAATTTPIKAPALFSDATIARRIGTRAKPIIFCGNQSGKNKTVIDGADSQRYKSVGIRVLLSRRVVVAGFTFRNVLKGIDIQGTNYSTFSYLTTTNTLQEGIRLRFASQYNLVERCTIKNSGLLWAGVGEGLYCGTSKKNSIDFADGRKDFSNYNIIQYNTFGPGIQAEAIDIKEFTRSGKILYNRFVDGRSIKGMNGAKSWVVVKGNNWIVANNTGSYLNTAFTGAGFRTTDPMPGEGINNRFDGNTCIGLRKPSVCIYLEASTTRANTITCSNKSILSRNMPKRALGLLCGSCNLSCAAARSARVKPITSGIIPELEGRVESGRTALYEY